MKMLAIVTDSEFVSQCMRTLNDRGIKGYTVVPEVFGVGRSGAKMGDRAHPGASAMILAAIEDHVVPELLGSMRACIEQHTVCESTHAWVMPVEASLDTLAG